MSALIPLQPEVSDRNGASAPEARATVLNGTPGTKPQAPAAATPEDSDSSGLTGAAFLRALRRRWPLAVTLGVVAMVGASAAAWYIMPAKRTARTLLRISSSQPAILFNVDNQNNGFANYQRNQLAMVKSRLVLNAALKQPSVTDLRVVREQPDPVQWLDREIKADFSLAPEILQIAISGDHPDELMTVVNAVREAYVQEIVEKESTERHARLEQLKKLYAEYDENLRDKRRTLRELAENIGSHDALTLAHKQQFAMERMALGQKELIQLQSDLRKAQVEAAIQPAREKALADQAIPTAAIEEQLKKDPAVAKQLADIAQLEVYLSEVKGTLVRGDKDPLLQKYRDQLAAARETLAAYRESQRPRIGEELREQARNEIKATGAAMNNKVIILKEQEKALAEEIKTLEADTRTINKGSIDLESLREEVSQAEDVAKKAGTQIEALKVELQAPPRVTLLEEATTSGGDGTRKQLMITAGSGIGAFLFALCGIVFWEFRAGRISTVEEVKQGLGMPLMGTLPPLKQPKHRRGTGPAADTPAGQLLIEAVDATRTVLLRTAHAESLQALMITSAVSGEGKTSLSGHLAASLARAGCRTLLIDGDLRNPALHDLFSQPRCPGLSELLRGEVELVDIIRTTPVPGLSLLTAGKCDDAALQALPQHGARLLIQQMKARYDIVLFDSAPVLPVADSLLIGQHVDAVLFSILRDVSCMPTVTAAYERLTLVGIRVIGAVVNGVRSPGSYGSSYGYGYGYGHGSRDRTAESQAPPAEPQAPPVQPVA
jgi:succinoglycan biosynthesis transport protein ExoP